MSTCYQVALVSALGAPLRPELWSVAVADLRFVASDAFPPFLGETLRFDSLGVPS